MTGKKKQQGENMTTEITIDTGTNELLDRKSVV